FHTTGKILAVFILGCAYLVLTLELAGIFNKLNKPFFIILVQALIVITACLLHYFNKLGLPPISVSKIKSYILSVPELIRNNIGTFIFFCLILCTYIFLAYLQVRFPQNTTDSLYNHLSRIGYWLQQGSLKPYSGFNNVGSSFPFINSLLMLWSVVFLRSDQLVGYVQFVAVFMLSISIYSMGKEFGFTRKANFHASLFFLTFPIILFESITAQNDILVACFLMIAFYFLTRFTQKTEMMYLVLSILSFSLAVGTKQYALFALPGYVALYVYKLWKLRSGIQTVLLKNALVAIGFIIVFSSYSYMQNWIYYGNPVGDSISLVQNSKLSQNETYLKKVTVNSLRLSYQFLSCEGFPPSFEKACIQAKTKIFKPILSSSIIDLESDAFLLDINEPFTFDKRYSLNEESSWYGMVGSLLILLAIPCGFFISIKNRRIEGVILIVSSFIFFLITSSVKTGWDPYVGRYLIFSIVLLLPFSAGFLGEKRRIYKIFLGIICSISVFIMVYSVLNNDSRPLISKKMFFDTSIWGRNNLVVIQKISDRLGPLTRHDRDTWALSEVALRTYANKTYGPVLNMVNKFTTPYSNLGILAHEGLVPDYIFFGETFNHIIIPFTSLEKINNFKGEYNFLLVSPDFLNIVFSDYVLISQENNWRFYSLIKISEQGE
ncbi:MAG: glycosyltransferase family 39 protein, partial [Desulfobacterales bacterium]|nr:glycosyltransferase family 39 protein [Desulfobacterales bacterium]